MAQNNFKASALTILHWTNVLIIFFILSLTFPKPIDLVTADLGRHLKSGEIFLATGQIVSTNYYSYAEGERPVINHHWFVGVIYQLIYKNFGFVGLSVFNLILFLFAVFFFYLVSVRLGKEEASILFFFLAFPLMIYRLEVRPEMISYFFFGFFWWCLEKFREKGSWPLVILLCVCQLIWVNSHIFFIFGPLLAFLYYLEHKMQRHNANKKNDLFLPLFCGLLGMCLLNPWGIRGALEPVYIFHAYGYDLAENQSIIFMHRRFPLEGTFIYFESVFAIVSLIGIASFFNKKQNMRFVPAVVFIGVSLIAWKMVRGITLFGFCSTVMGGYAMSLIVKNFSLDKQKKMWAAVTCLTSFVILLGFIWPSVYFAPKYQMGRFVSEPNVSFGSILIKYPQSFGLREGVDNSAVFFKKTGIKGPIFNNYDIGGYLIFHLFPKEKVFVDNRPESYSVDFLKKTYVPMQEDEIVWEKKDQEYQFNVIYFYRLDITPWAQPFLIERIEDPRWAPVYVDNYTLILLRRNEQNANIIRRYELPRSMFTTHPT